LIGSAEVSAHPGLDVPVRGVRRDHPEPVVGQLGDGQIGLDRATLVEPLGVGDHAGLAIDVVGTESFQFAPGVTALQGALIEPLAIAWHTVNRCAVSAGQVVAIHGAGPIGVGAFLTLRRRGVAAIVVDPSATRRAALAGLGAQQVLDPAACDVVAAIRDLTGGRGADASIDAAGAPQAFAAMLHGTRVDGTAVVVAIHHEPVVIPPFDLLMPEVHLTGVALSVNAFPAVIAEMARGSYPLEGWVETIPFDGVIEQGIERLRRQQGMKIVVDVAGRSGHLR